MDETCKHCGRPIHRLGGMSANGPLNGWADDDPRSPHYCPASMDFAHKPVEDDGLTPAGVERARAERFRLAWLSARRGRGEARCEVDVWKRLAKGATDVEEDE